MKWSERERELTAREQDWEETGKSEREMCGR